MKISKPKGEGWLGRYSAGTEKDNTFLGYQKKEYDIAISKTTNRRLALDIGANLGIMSYRMVSDFKIVHAFEPLFYQHLELNVPASNLEIHPYAVGDKETTLTMRIAEWNSGGSNVVKDKVFDSTRYKDVQSVTIDSYDFRDVDLIKIDVEKYEYHVLVGARRTIENNKPTILIEIDQVNQTTVFEYLTNLNYTIEKIVGKDYVCTSNLLSL